jgi:maleate isomerase
MSLRLGMLTPSSNTVLEPATTRILAGLHDVSVHFSRFRVTEIGLDAPALNQFDEAPMLAAAELLADAKVDVVSWNGASAGWRGLDSDRRLCARIVETTGAKASTCVLSLFDLVRRRGDSRIGLVTPYTENVQQAIIANFAREGVTTVSERHSGLRDNFSFSGVSGAELAGMIEATAAARPDAIVVLCTNLAAAPLVADLEARLDVTIHDSVATTIYGALAAAGADPSRVKGFGRLFET